MQMNATRRAILGQTAAAFAATPLAAAAAQLKPTSQETIGPYYPTVLKGDLDDDLSLVKGHARRALGEIIEIRGRVLSPNGAPVSQARMLIWQANAAGRYFHPDDPNLAAKIDPDFQGAALFRTGADGSFRLKTVKPGAYPGPGDRLRAPHIHFQVTGHDNRLEVQMFFPGEPLNDQDILYSTMPGRFRDQTGVVARRQNASEPGVTGFAWDIVLAGA
jgi:protocatechuate 3,4-dioxygenase beta subunit